MKHRDILLYFLAALFLSSCSPEFDEFGQQQGKLKTLNTSISVTPEDVLLIDDEIVTHMDFTLEGNVLHASMRGIIAPEKTRNVSVKTNMENQTLFISIDFRGVGDISCGLMDFYTITCDITPIQKHCITIIIEVHSRQLQMQADFTQQNSVFADFYHFY